MGVIDTCLGPVTIADQEAELSMTSILQENFPNHAMLVNCYFFS